MHALPFLSSSTSYLDRPPVPFSFRPPALLYVTDPIRSDAVERGVEVSDLAELGPQPLPYRAEFAWSRGAPHRTEMERPISVARISTSIS